MRLNRLLTVLIALGQLLPAPVFSRPALRRQQPETVHGVQPETAPMNCDAQRALLLIAQQIDEARNLEAINKQIPLLIRSAQLLWPRQQKNAREVFTRAFELAERRFKEKGDEAHVEGRLVIEVQDFRFAVIEGIARFDPAWAGQLADRIAADARRAAEGAKDGVSKANGAPSMTDKILRLAGSMTAIDPQAAIGLARSTLGSLNHSMGYFLYQLAAANQQSADRFYEEVLGVAGSAPLADFFYLSAYPFARNRILGPEALSSSLPVLPGVGPNPRLQQLFLEALTRRAEIALNAPEQAVGGSYRLPDPAQLLIAFFQLETLSPPLPPPYPDRMALLKPGLNALIPGELREQMASFMQPQGEFGDGSGFQRNLDKAEQERDPARREQYYAQAVLNASDSENLDRVLSLLGKINSAQLRSQVSNYLYFKRTQAATKAGRLDDANALAAKVEQLDLRAYLTYEIASAALKELRDRNRAREVLDEVEKLALKAVSSNERARTLLGVAHLYSKFDSLRAFEVIREAVKTINQLSEPDFTSGYVTQKIEGPTFAFYAVYPVEGFTLEDAFRPLAPVDFDGALLVARSFDDKSLRAAASLALASACLQNAARGTRPAGADGTAPSGSREHPKSPPGKNRN